MSFWAEYSIFALETFTIVLAVIIVLLAFVAIKAKAKKVGQCGHLKVKSLNEEYYSGEQKLGQQIYRGKEKTQWKKSLKRKAKQLKQQHPKIFVFQFQGDIQASQVEALREEVSAIIQMASVGDEAVLLLESPGGVVNNYGLAASQLDRLKQANIRLTVLIDSVAASGGYLMACVADRIIAAPFALIGSIGVLMQMPNFNQWLERRGIAFEQIKAGEHKRNLTMFGKNTDQERQKTQQQIEEIHSLFKDFVHDHRPSLNIDEVATGEYWLATWAQQKGLVDELQTSDDYLLAKYRQAECLLFRVKFHAKKRGLRAKLSQKSQMLLRHL